MKNMRALTFIHDARVTWQLSSVDMRWKTDDNTIYVAPYYGYLLEKRKYFVCCICTWCCGQSGLGFCIHLFQLYVYDTYFYQFILHIFWDFIKCSLCFHRHRFFAMHTHTHVYEAWMKQKTRVTGGVARSLVSCIDVAGSLTIFHYFYRYIRMETLKWYNTREKVI